MLENNSTKPRNPRRVRHSAVEPEEIVKKTQKRGRRPSTKKQGLILPGQLQKILVAAIIFSLGSISFIAFVLVRDTTPPVIKSVSFSDMIGKSAAITWQTDEPATSQVVCGPDVCTPTEPDEALATNHFATLSDLKPNTRYHLILISRDKGGNEARLEIELTTPVQPYATPPMISGLKVFNTTDSSATITWQTDRPATSQVEYGETDSYSLITPPDEELTTHHGITLTGLKPTNTYHFSVKSRDAGGNEAISEARTFITLSTGAAAVEVAPELGKRAPDFTLPTLDGKQLSLGQFHGKMVMVNFWMTSCSACATEMPYIQAVFDKWSRDDLEILAISVGEQAAFVHSFADRRGLTLTALLDSDEAVSKIYQISVIPTTLFINADGIIMEIKKGRFTSQFEIEDILKSL
jgi:peroxiredoxin